MDIINPDRGQISSVSICSRVSILQGVKVSIFPIGNWRRRYNSAALPRSLWLLWKWFPGGFGFVCLGELLYVYDLVVIADSEKEVIRKFYVWKDGLEMIEGEFV